MKRYVFLILAMLTIFISTILLTNCAPTWQKKDGEPYPCFKARDCQHRTKKPCIDQDKECRAYARYILCKDPKFRIKEHSWQQCWDKLNSK